MNMASLYCEGDFSNVVYKQKHKRQRRQEPSGMGEVGPVVDRPPASPNVDLKVEAAQPKEGGEGKPEVTAGDIDEKETSVVFFFSSYWEQVAKKEKSLYGAKDYSGYRPGEGHGKSVTPKQLKEAATEFLQRYKDDEYTPEYCAVLVAEKVKQTPYRSMELTALQGTGATKAWYSLTGDGDLMIIKLRSGDLHSKCVHKLGYFIEDFCRQYPGIFHADGDGDHRLQSGTIVAPDAFMQQVHPTQPASIPLIRSPLIIEFEHKYRGPKALMEVLSTYFVQSPVEYCLGIKVYDRTGPVVAAGKRPFAAVAILWRRHPTHHNRARAVGYWSFGTQDLSPQSKSAFKKKRGVLGQLSSALMVHPCASTVIRIPNARLVRNQIDQQGNPVVVVPTANDLTVDLSILADIIDDRLKL